MKEKCCLHVLPYGYIISGQRIQFEIQPDQKYPLKRPRANLTNQRGDAMPILDLKQIDASGPSISKGYPVILILHGASGI
jgi:hypothetical protein